MYLTMALMLAAATYADAPVSLLGRVEMDCLICGQHFVSVASVQQNTRGGVDRDRFARAVGPQPVYYLIATCPKCGYSGYPADFDPSVAIPPDVRDKILKKPGLPLPAGFTPESDPRELDASDRYRLAITCYTWRQRSDEALGWLHLRASWVARDEGAILPPDDRLARVMHYVQRWRPALEPGGNQLDVEMKLITRMAEAQLAGQFNRYQEPYVRLACALILRRHGENRQAESMLRPLLKSERFTERTREGIERMLGSIATEREHQGAAVEYFERAVLSGQVTQENVTAARYLLGELCRRLDRDGDAITWFDQALHDAGIEAHLKQWAEEQRAWAAAGAHVQEAVAPG